MRFAVFGTGGVGGYFGGRLAQAGEDVTFIARGRHLEAIQTSGLKVESVQGDFIVHPAQATDNSAEVGVVDVVLLGVKTWQIPEAAEAIRSLIGPQTFVLPLENGVEAPAELAKTLGLEHVIGGLCGIISFIAGPGHIRHIGADPIIRFGELDNQVSDRVERLRHTFARAEGFIAEVPGDIQIAMWQKFLLIVSSSGVGAITRVPLGNFLSIQETRQMLKEVMWEVFKVAHAHNIALPDDVIDKTLYMLDGLPPEGTTSMQRDIMEGRPSELEAQTGAVVRLGQEVGVETPINKFIYHSLLPSELKARGEGIGGNGIKP